MKVYKVIFPIWIIGTLFIHAVHSQDASRAFSVSGITSENYLFPFAGGMNACQFGQIDLNLDGIKDLVAFDRQGNRLMPFLNNGTPGIIDYAFAPDYTSEFPDFYYWVIFTDYNMDGKEDIFAYNPQNPGIIVYKNTSTSELRFERVIFPYLTSWYGSGYVNILVTLADYPGISDIDGDGDLDILTFWALGSFVEMHKNLSIETYGHADSLIFERTTSCWGYFAESAESNDLFLDTCPEKKSNNDVIMTRERHTGSTFLLTDMNNNNTKDLLLGDVDYPQLIYMLNDGTMEDAHIGSYNHAFPNDNDPSWIYSMPVAALIDVNNDGDDDLLVSPFDPNPFITQNHSSVWLYLNQGSNELPDFELNTKRFLQQDMIDCGSGAYPAFADINLDGLQDIIIGNYGYYKSSWYDSNMILHSDYASSMAIFMNKGEPDKPQYEYITDDFGFIREMNILGAYPTFGDIDTDDDADMIVGRDDGTLMFYRNCSCLGNPEDFELEEVNYQGIDVDDFSTPFLYDIDEDGLIDLIIGEKAGNINFYKNTGDAYDPIFTFVTDSLGKVNVTDPGFSWYGYSTPYMFRAQDGNMRLVSGSEQGIIYYYTNIEDNLQGSFEQSDELWEEIDSVEFSFARGYRTSAAIANLNGDGYLDMAVGNFSGGLNLYSTEFDPAVTMELKENAPERLADLHIFPNPANSTINISCQYIKQSELYILKIIDINGNILIEEQVLFNSNKMIEVSSLTNGIYICTISDNHDHSTLAIAKIIIQR